MAETPRATAPGQARRAGAAAALVRRLVEEACNGGDLTILDQLLPRAALEDTGARPGAARLREVLPAFRAAVPDAHWQIEEHIAADETVVTRLAVRGTFAGVLVGLAPPGRPATLRGVAICRFARGRLVEVWLQADLLSFLQELGVLPPLDLTRTVTMARVLRAGARLAEVVV